MKSLDEQKQVCADCSTEQPAHLMYGVTRPADLVDLTGESRRFHLCRKCWDRIIDNAAFNIFRSM